MGHYLFDQFYVKNTVVAIVPEARGGKGDRALMGGGGYIPRFRNLKGKEKNFIRGYAYDFIRCFAPPLTRALVDQALAQAPGTSFDI